MKHVTILILFVSSLTLNAQAIVSTITDPIKGSGGLTLDTKGNLYISDFGDMLGGPDTDGVPNNILRMDPDLNITIYATGFGGASGNTFDNNGVLYQSDIRANGIYKVVNGERVFVTSDGIASPVGIIFDANDNFYVCNCGDSTIRKVTPDGTSTLFSSGPLFACPNGMTIDDNGNLYVVNFSNSNIVKITPDGTPEIIANTPFGNGHIDYDPNTERLYIASYHGNQIFRFSLSDNNPKLILVAGSGIRGNDDGDAMSATFSTPNGIVVSADGNTIYVNCAVPLSGVIINPQVIRTITGVLSIGESINEENKVILHPNPTQETLHISLKNVTIQDDIQMQIHDNLGNLIKTVNNIKVGTPGLEKTLDVSSWSSGVYLISLKTTNQLVYSGKFLKK